MSVNEIGQAFSRHWYETRQSGNMDSLASLFQPTSMMTFEGQQFQGPELIMAKLNNIANGARYQIATTDVQPSVVSSALLIFVTGTLVLDADKPIQFSEVIQLVSHIPGQYYVHNCLFRLCYSTM